MDSKNHSVGSSKVETSGLTVFKGVFRGNELLISGVTRIKRVLDSDYWHTTTTDHNSVIGTHLVDST